MLEDAHPVLQTLLGTLFTWGMTAAGSALVFIFSSGQRKILDGSLGFAAGVMVAASYWSLLAPAIEMAESSGWYGETGQWAFLPVAIGFVLGSLFVYAADLFLPSCGQLIEPLNGTSETKLAMEEPTVQTEGPRWHSEDMHHMRPVSDEVRQSILVTLQDENQLHNQPFIRLRPGQDTLARQRKALNQTSPDSSVELITQGSASAPGRLQSNVSKTINWRRILLLIIAITVHNIPEGLAVGVGFGAIGKSKAATIENARNLAFGIGIQNFPEGLAVSLPLRASGVSPWKSFWYGQLSGMVEPIAGILGALAVTFAEPILPYALAFAAGAMIYVVVDDIIPEAQTSGNGKLASWGSVLGFIVMMSLDVGLG